MNLPDELASHSALKSSEPSDNPTQVARKLRQYYETDLGVFFAELVKLPLKNLCETLMELPSEIFEEALSRIPSKKMAAALSHLDSDDLTDFLQRVKQYDQDYAKNTYQLLAPDEQAEVNNLSQFPVDQAGAFMQLELLSAQLSDTQRDIKQKIRTFRKEEPNSPIVKLFVVDSEQHLLATLHFTDLMLFEEQESVETMLAQIAPHKPLSVQLTTPIERVMQLFEEYGLITLAVVNTEGVLQGRIIYEDVYDLIRLQEHDQALKMAGADDEAEEESLKSARIARLHWLLINLSALLCAVYIIDIFDHTIEQLVALAVLMPIVAALGGNVGNQAVTVTVRKIALGEIDWQNAYPVIRREVIIGAINGGVMGIAVAIIAMIWFHQAALGLVIAVAVALNLAIAGLIGSMIPLLIKKFNGDPAIASPLLLTTATDAIGFLVFLGLADLVLI